MLAFIAWIVCVFLFWYIAAALADRRNRSIVWCFAAALFPPSILILLALPDLPPKGKDWKTCPHCLESVKAAAKACRYCGNTLEGA